MTVDSRTNGFFEGSTSMESAGALYPLVQAMMTGKRDATHAFWESRLVLNKAEAGATVVKARDFSYMTTVRQMLVDNPDGAIVVDGEEFGAHGMVQSVRKEFRSKLRSKYVRRITALAMPGQVRFADLVGTVVITGGAGGLGLLYTEYLLQNYARCKVVVASRSVAEGADDGADPRLTMMKCDVCSKEDVERVVAAIPDLVGIIHCAGVGAGGPFKITNEEDRMIQTMLKIKYDGTRYLHDATKESGRMRFFMLASSISAAVGDFNVTHYAAANSCMDTFAEAERAKGYSHVMSVQWGALETGSKGMAQGGTKKLMDQRGHGVVQPDDMIDVLEVAIHQCGDWPAVVLVSPLNVGKIMDDKAELADDTSMFHDDKLRVYIDIAKAKYNERLADAEADDPVFATDGFF